MNILLVTSPHLDHSALNLATSHSVTKDPVRYAQTFVPMGLLSIAGAVNSLAKISIADLNKAINSAMLPMSQNFYQAAAEWLLDFDPDLIGFMTETDSYHHLLQICKAIKSIRPETLTLFGGVYATVNHRDTLRAFSVVDYIIRSEGEAAFQSLIDALIHTGDMGKVGNLTYRVGGAIISNPELPLIQDLDSLPWPDFSLIDLNPQDDIWIEIGRGCPFKCNFCVTAPYWKRKHRIKSPDRIIRELNEVKNTYDRTDFNFTHDLFTTNRKWVLRFCRQLVDSELNVTWTCSSRTDTLDEEQIYWMQRAGCRDIYFGVETGTQEMQAKIDKNQNLDYADYIICKTKEAGINPTVGFISGLPGESDVSLRGTLKRAYSYLRLPESTVHLFGYCPYRGSPTYESIKDDLLFDSYFADFPLSVHTHLENCEIMKNHFEIFSRFSRLNYYENLSIDVIRAAEEYLPNISILRSVIFKLDEEGVDPLDLLQAWAKWIKNQNKIIGKSKSQLYYGAIRDFIFFLKFFIQQEQLEGPVYSEMIEWELLKDQFRSNKYEPPIVKNTNNGSDTIWYTNPSAVTATFEHVGNFCPDNLNMKPGTFVFYTQRNDDSEIVRIQPIAQLVLNIANKGVTLAQLTHIIDRTNRTSLKRSPQKNQSIQNLLKQLEQMELLIRAN